MGKGQAAQGQFAEPLLWLDLGVGAGLSRTLSSDEMPPEMARSGGSGLLGLASDPVLPKPHPTYSSKVLQSYKWGV